MRGSPREPEHVTAPFPELPRECQAFGIGFDPQDTDRVLESWRAILAGRQWTDGPFTQRFEERWSAWNGLPAAALSSWTGGAMACLEYFRLRGKKILCPSNTFMATPLAALAAGAEVVFGDCNRDDLCLSYDAVVQAAREHALGAVWLVHIGGHLAFDTPRISEFCRAQGIILLEDCAHAHGASWRGQRPGSWGDAGVYSFYATKTISTGEGGVLVSKHPDVVEFARAYRNYGKPSYQVHGLNFRMSEFTAALGLVQIERMDAIVAWKNAMARRYLDPVFERRVRLPDGMVSGLYKYVVFEPIERSSGKVYDTPCHRLLGHRVSLPNTEWIATHHWCVPLYYRPDVAPDETADEARSSAATGAANGGARGDQPRAERAGS